MFEVVSFQINPNINIEIIIHNQTNLSFDDKWEKYGMDIELYPDKPKYEFFIDYVETKYLFKKDNNREKKYFTNKEEVLRFLSTLVNKEEIQKVQKKFKKL